MRRFNVVLVLISSSGLFFGQVHPQPQQRQIQIQHQALNHPANFNQYPPIQNIFGNLFRPGAAQPLIPAQHPQFHPNAPNGALPPPPPPPPPLPPQPSPHQGNTAAPAQPTAAQGSNIGQQQPGNRRQPPPPPLPPPPPPPGGPSTRARLPQVRSGPQRTQPRQQRPPPPHSSNNGRNPPPPPVPHTHPPPVAETSNGPNPSAPLNNQIISLTSNFGEEPVSYETTTHRKESIGSSSTSTTEFTPSPTHIINFEFDGDADHHIGQDVVYDTFGSVNPDLVSNDLSLVAPPTDHVEKQVDQDQLPFKLTPRGHSAPVIISQIPFKSTQTSNQVVKEPMPEAVENRRQETTYFDGEDLSPSDTLLSEQVYKQDRPPSDGEAPNPAGDSQRIQAKANSNFYFRSDTNTNPSPHSSEAGDDARPGRTNRLLNHHHQHHHSNHSHNVISLTESEEVQKTTPEEEEQVRGLVDCGGRDLGFCDMSSKYPGHMMGNLMSDCQELVYRGFVPVPEDLEELGDSDPVAKYSNSSKSAVRAQTGSWSWKPYAFKKKQVCDSELRFIRPGYARDSTGKWQVIVQTEELPQRVAIDLCHSPDKPCRLMSDCGQKSKCLQRYNFQHLLAVDPDNLHDCPTIRAFKFPSACVCHIEYPDYF